MRLISWNVNGLRAVMKKNFYTFLEAYDPDVLCLQEVKACKDTVKTLSVPFKHAVFHCAQKKGYSGTAIFSKYPPLLTLTDCKIDQECQEGRVLVAEFEFFYLVCVYTPNSKSQLERLGYRYREWDPQFLLYIKSLEQKKPVIVCGDLNVAHQEIDLANPQDNHFCAGFTKEEREGITNVLEEGFIDTFRYFYPNTTGAYSWWSYRTNARARNVGWRIDYFLASQALKDKLKNAYIYDQVLGSDHAPVGIELLL